MERPDWDVGEEMVIKTGDGAGEAAGVVGKMGTSWFAHVWWIVFAVWYFG